MRMGQQQRLDWLGRGPPAVEDGEDRQAPPGDATTIQHEPPAVGQRHRDPLAVSRPCDEHVQQRAIEVVGEIVARVRISPEPRDAGLVELSGVLILTQLTAEMTSPLPELLAPRRLLLSPPGSTRGTAQGQVVDLLQPVDRLV